MIYSAKSIMFYLRVRVVSVVPQRVLSCICGCVLWYHVGGLWIVDDCRDRGRRE